MLNPAHALLGGLSYLICVCLSVCVCVCVCPFTKYLKKFKPINFIFGGGLPSDPGRKPFDFDKNRPGVRVGVCGGGVKFGPNDKR